MAKLFSSLFLRVLIVFLLIIQQFFITVNALEVPQHKLKTVYLIHLSDYTTWPSEKMEEENFLICVDSENELYPTLNELTGRSVNNKTLKIISPSSLKDVTDCHVFYVSPEDASLFNNNQTILEKNSVLTVRSEEDFANEDFASTGGIIGFYIENKRVKMKVNLEKIERSRLKISSKLLRLMNTDI